ncbi:TldD protein [Actinobacillus equuli]|nr:TldD protein [Actinobacillus equuli]
MTGDTRAVYLAKEAVRMALVNLGAMPAPAGTMPIVLGAGWPGIYYMKRLGTV